MANILQQIESRYPVETILVNGEQAWPYLRIRFHLNYTAQAVGSYGEAKAVLQSPHASRPLRILRFIRTTLSALSYGFPSWLRRYRYIVLTDSSVRRHVDGKYMNRFLDAIINELGPARVLCIETTPTVLPYSISDSYTKHVVSWNVLTSASQVFALLRRLLGRQYAVVDRGLLDRIKAEFGLGVQAPALVEAHEARRKVFACLFRIMRPRAILLTCYYGKESAIRAAKDLGIRVVEVQHGAIGKEHPAYNVYRDIDRSCFPDHLLVFGREELATFDNSRFIDPANVHPVGSYYIDYIRDNYRPDPQLREEWSSYKRVVGVTLQWTFERRLIGFISEAAKLDAGIFYLLIPREPEKQEYSEMVLPQNVAVIRDKNFYELMAYCHFHSTVNSTCALEAPALGVQNILVDIDGAARAYYEKALTDDRVTRFADSPAQYVDIISTFARLDRDAVCKLHDGFFTPDYHENIRDFVRTQLP